MIDSLEKYSRNSRTNALLQNLESAIAQFKQRFLRQLFLQQCSNNSLVHCIQMHPTDLARALMMPAFNAASKLHSSLCCLRGTPMLITDTQTIKTARQRRNKHQARPRLAAGYVSSLEDSLLTSAGGSSRSCDDSKHQSLPESCSSSWAHRACNCATSASSSATLLPLGAGL